MIAAAADPIPTLNEVALAVLLLLLGLVAADRLRKIGGADQHGSKRPLPPRVVFGVAFIIGGGLLRPAAAHAETPKELADTQLIVLFDPRLGPPPGGTKPVTKLFRDISWGTNLAKPSWSCDG